MSQFDKRVFERNIKRGVITKKEHEEYLKEEEDCSDNMTVSEVRFVHKVRSEVTNEDKDGEKDK